MRVWASAKIQFDYERKQMRDKGLSVINSISQSEAAKQIHGKPTICSYIEINMCKDESIID